MEWNFTLGDTNDSPPAAGGFNVFVAFEDFAAAKRARALFERVDLALQTGGNGRLHCAHWKFKNSTSPERIKIAAEGALSADMIVIAARERAAMPKVLKQWIAHWFSRKKEHCALVALLDRPAAASDREKGIRAYLGKVAARSNFAFFAEGMDGFPAAMPEANARSEPSPHRVRQLKPTAARNRFSR